MGNISGGKDSVDARARQPETSTSNPLKLSHTGRRLTLRRPSTERCLSPWPAPSIHPFAHLASRSDSGAVAARQLTYCWSALGPASTRLLSRAPTYDDHQPTEIYPNKRAGFRIESRSIRHIVLFGQNTRDCTARFAGICPGIRHTIEWRQIWYHRTSAGALWALNPDHRPRVRS